MLLEPPILLLDDPTAAIDPRDRARDPRGDGRAPCAGRTTFVVAHRLQHAAAGRPDPGAGARAGSSQRGTHERAACASRGPLPPTPAAAADRSRADSEPSLPAGLPHERCAPSSAGRPTQPTLAAASRDRDEAEDGPQRPLDLRPDPAAVRLHAAATRASATALLRAGRAAVDPVAAAGLGDRRRSSTARSRTATPRASLWGAAAFAGCWPLFTQVILHFRQRLALELGEAVVHDLRNDDLRPPAAHADELLPPHQARAGSSAASPPTSRPSASACRTCCSSASCSSARCSSPPALMLWYDCGAVPAWCSAMAPVLWVLNRHFRRRLSQRLPRRAGELQPRHRHAGRVGQRHPRHPGLRAPGRQRRACSTSWSPTTRATTCGAARTAGVFLPLLEFNSQFFIAALLLRRRLPRAAPGAGMHVGDLIQFFFLANLFFAPDPDPRQPVQPGADGHGRRRARLPAARHASPTGATRPTPSTCRRMRGPGRVPRRVASATSPAGRCCTTSTSRPSRARPSPWWATPAAARRTIINLIAKFYLPTAGELLIDGRDIRDDRQRLAAPPDGHRAAAELPLHRHGAWTTSASGGPAPPTRRSSRRRAQLDCLDLIEALPDGLADRGRRARRPASRSASGSWSASPGPCWPTRAS